MGRAGFGGWTDRGAELKQNCFQWSGVGALLLLKIGYLSIYLFISYYSGDFQLVTAFLLLWISLKCTLWTINDILVDPYPFFVLVNPYQVLIKEHSSFQWRENLREKTTVKGMDKPKFWYQNKKDMDQPRRHWRSTVYVSKTVCMSLNGNWWIFFFSSFLSVGSTYKPQCYIQLFYWAPLSITLTISDQKIVSVSLFFQLFSTFSKKKNIYKSHFM